MDSERPIEKLLRTSAKKRADEAGEPLSLHPATRRLLQAEITRVYGGRQTDSPKASSAWSLARLWPGLGWALTVVAGLVAAASLMLPQRNAKSYELAMQNSQRSFADKVSHEPAAAPAETRLRVEPQNTPAAAKELLAESAAANGRQPEPQPLLAYDAPGQKAITDNLARTAHKDGVVRDEAKAAAPAAPAVASAAAPPPATSASGSAKKADDLRSDFGQPPSDGKTPALTAAAGPLPTERARLKLEKAADAPLAHTVLNEESKTVNRFVQAPSGSGGLLDKAIAPVLASFDFEQSGSQIRIVDADGSVYTGTLRPPANAQAVAPQSISSGRLLSGPSTKFNLLAATAVSEPAEADKDAAATFSFQVEGTNQTLKQKVVLTGALFNNAQSTDREGARTFTNAVVEKTPSKPALLGQPALAKPISRISGRATVGGAGFDINAVQAPR